MIVLVPVPETVPGAGLNQSADEILRNATKAKTSHQ